MKNPQKKKINIYIDLDGVLTDFTGASCKVNGIDLTESLKRRLMSGEWLDKIVDEDRVWNNIKKSGIKWWADLPLLPWAKLLVNNMKHLGDVTFLTSPGDYNIHTEVVSHACAGKVLWAKKHFPGHDLVLARSKYKLANENSILIDDTIDKLKDFKDHGGHIFLWPNQYEIVENNSIYTTLEKLEKLVKSMCHQNSMPA